MEVRTLKDWRERVYFESQREFARRIHATEAAVSVWERGLRHPRMKTRRLVAERLGLKTDQIIWGEGGGA